MARLGIKTYRFTARDAMNMRKPRPDLAPRDAWSDYQARMVTPYGFLPENLPGFEKYAAGDLVSINLDRSAVPLELWPFTKLPSGVEWLDVDEADVTGSATLGDLCDRLLAKGEGQLKAKYGGLYDAFKKKDTSSANARRSLAKAIFDHWDNTNYRYAVIGSGKFNWTDAYDKPWDLPTQGDAQGSDGSGGTKRVTYRVLKVPTHSPVVVPRAVAPASPATDSAGSTKNDLQVMPKQNVMQLPPPGKPPVMQVGYNYPWPWDKYGCYFGEPAEPWIAHWLDVLPANLSEIADLGMKVVRIFLVCNGNNWGKMTPHSYSKVVQEHGGGFHQETMTVWSFDPPDATDPRCTQQLKKMLECFRQAGMQVIPSFIDFGLLAPAYEVGGGSGRTEAVTNLGKRVKLLSFLDDLLQASKGYEKEIYAWEVVNEPCWNTRVFAPPVAETHFGIKATTYIPVVPTVSEDVMRDFLGAACKRIESAGFESTVGHRFYDDLSNFPTGTKPQFHYYPQALGPDVIGHGEA
jgi:hypothetical protein